MAGPGRPAAGDDERRERVLTTKINKLEGDAWDRVRLAMGAAGPMPRDADALRWLIGEECKRRGIAWPGAVAEPEESATQLPGKCTKRGETPATRR